MHMHTIFNEGSLKHDDIKLVCYSVANIDYFNIDSSAYNFILTANFKDYFVNCTESDME